MPGRWIGACLLALMSLQYADAAGRIVWTPCPAHARGTASAAAMQCGWLHTDDRIDGAAVVLRVVILKARPDRRRTAPIVFLPGGPGDPAHLDAAALRAWRTFQQRADWPDDIVLFDPRGTGDSRPRPACPDRLPRHNVRAPAVRRAETRASEQANAAADCFRALGAATAAALGPQAQLADLGDLIAALHVDSVNLWAVSYGTRLALSYVLRYPQSVRAMALDSLVPFGTDGRTAMAVRIERAIARLDAYCRARSACSIGGGAPRTTLRRLLARYASHPPEVAWTDAPPNRAQTLSVTPYRLLLMLLLADYKPRPATDTIMRLRAADAGDPQALAPLVAPIFGLLGDQGHSRPVYWSTRCGYAELDQGGSRGADALRPDYADIAPYLSIGARYAACAHWPVPQMTASPRNAALPVPTLVLGGSEDVVTSRSSVEDFVARHPGTPRLRVAGAAHAASFSSVCARRLLARFWRAPGAPLPSRCHDRVGSDHR